MLIVINNLDGQVEEADEKLSRKSTPSPSVSATESDTLNIVDQKYYTLYPVVKECEIPEFVETIEGLSYKSGSGYGFYQFTKPELISYDKQVILMGKVWSFVVLGANETILIASKF